MAKRTVALLAALIILWPAPASASSPLWPCVVPVSIEPGPFHDAAVVAVEQLDAATVMSWPVVETGAMVTISWDAGVDAAFAWSAWTDTGMVAGGIEIDSDIEPRWQMGTLLHELGHIAGLDHNDEVRSVMNMVEVPWRKYQQADLDALAEVECQ